MPIPNMPPCPDSLKIIQHYLQIANEHDARDPVISYWCRYYALQNGIKIDKTSPEAKKLLFFLMEWLETEKNKNRENEAIAHDIPAQAHLENHALKLFLWADQQDRAAVFNKNVVKAFYTAGMIYSVLETFGELTEEVAKNQKYAKWKAAYIHNCLKNGETPIPGPAAGDDDELELNVPGPAPSSTGGIGFSMPGAPNVSGFPGVPPSSNAAGLPGPGMNNFPSVPTSPPRNPPASPMAPSEPVVPPTMHYNIPPNVAPEEPNSPSSNVSLDAALITKAQKYCKYASSALNYDDVPTAVDNLTKALKLLQTGRDD